MKNEEKDFVELVLLRITCKEEMVDLGTRFSFGHLQ